MSNLPTNPVLLGQQNQQLVQEIDNLLDESLKRMKSVTSEINKKMETEEERLNTIQTLDKLIEENEEYEKYVKQAMEMPITIKQEKVE